MKKRVQTQKKVKMKKIQNPIKKEKRKKQKKKIKKIKNIIRIVPIQNQNQKKSLKIKEKTVFRKRPKKKILLIQALHHQKDPNLVGLLRKSKMIKRKRKANYHLI